MFCLLVGSSPFRWIFGNLLSLFMHHFNYVMFQYIYFISLNVMSLYYKTQDAHIFVNQNYLLYLSWLHCIIVIVDIHTVQICRKFNTQLRKKRRSSIAEKDNDRHKNKIVGCQDIIYWQLEIAKQVQRLGCIVAKI